MYGQDFKFFNLLDIFKNREKVEGTGECVDVYDFTDFNMRWIEPPIPIYYISTLDEFGNSNVAPISLGTCCCCLCSVERMPPTAQRGQIIFPNHTAVPGRAGIHLPQAGSKSRLSAESLAPTQTLLNGV